MDQGQQPLPGDERLTEFLASTALFRGCERDVVRMVVPHVEGLEVAAGEPLATDGAQGQGIGFLVSGRAKVWSVDPSSGTTTDLHELRAGDHYGEVGAVSDAPQPFRILAIEPCRVLVLHQAVVDQLGQTVPAFSRALAASLSRRLVEAAARPSAPGAAAPAAPSQVEIPFVRVSSYQMVSTVLELVPDQLIQRHRMLPLDLQQDALTVGMVDPYDRGALRELSRVLQSVQPRIVAISAQDFEEAVARLRLDLRVGSSVRANQISREAIVFEEMESEREAAQTTRAEGEKVIQLTTEIVAIGLERGASDIHIESVPTTVRIRYRVNGRLTDWDQAVPPHMAKPLLARFKVLSGVDITEKRRPQDGRIGVRVGQRDVDIRVSTLPGSAGEKLVLRIFEATQMIQGTDQIFVERRTLQAVKDVLDRPYGAVVVAGPTGAGKSSTLYAALHERRRARPDINILTVEDPVEYRIAGVTQVQVNHAIGLGFAQVLRAMLRQDPDVVMVGEVRDSETAKLALEASMTGHLLFTSIHANNAPAVIHRLESLGCNRTEIAQSMALILVQRLARRLCPRCTVTEPVQPILEEALAKRKLYDRSKPMPLPRGIGCPACDNTGFVGRVAVVESMVFTDDTRAMLMADRPLDEIMKAAAATGAIIGFAPYARFMMRHGLISPAEALLTVAG